MPTSSRDYSKLFTISGRGLMGGKVPTVALSTSAFFGIFSVPSYG